MTKLNSYVVIWAVLGSPVVGIFRFSGFLLVSLFIRAPDLGFPKTLYSKARFFIFDPARRIRNTSGFLLE